jgi:hypothetical protein
VACEARNGVPECAILAAAILLRANDNDDRPEKIK